MNANELQAIEERAKLYVGVAEGRGHLDALARDVLSLVEEVRRLRRELHMAKNLVGSGISQESPLGSNPDFESAYEVLDAALDLFRDPAGEAK